MVVLVYILICGIFAFFLAGMGEGSITILLGLILGVLFGIFHLLYNILNIIRSERNK